MRLFISMNCSINERVSSLENINKRKDSTCSNCCKRYEGIVEGIDYRQQEVVAAVRQNLELPVVYDNKD